MKMKKFIAVLTMAGMMTALAAGCGSDNGSDSGDSGEWDAAKEITVVSREEGSGTRGAFTELFGVVDEDDNDMTTLEAQTTNNTSVMMTTVAGNKNAIGYISLGSLNDTVKALSVDGAEPTVDNIKSGDYKVSRPFNIVTTGNESEVTKDFISFIMSEEGQKIVEEEGYISQGNEGAYAGT